jgi:cyclic di-GMP phosphodiesterase Gmr
MLELAALSIPDFQNLSSFTKGPVLAGLARPGQRAPGGGGHEGDLLKGAVALLALVDAEGWVVLGNDAFANLTGRPSEDVGVRASDLLPLAPGPEGVSDMISAVRSGRPVNEAERVYIDDLGNRRRIHWVFTVVAAPVPGPARSLAVTGLDVTEHRLAEASWRQRAETDALTGVANRIALGGVLDTLLDLERGTGCGLLFCDLDGFKGVNDTLGHQVGDEVLVEVTRRLLRAVRPGDVVARLGGDEFVILVPAAGSVEVRAVAARIERAIGSPVRTSAGTARIGVSIGVQIADPGDDPADVLRAADSAMYVVKSARAQRRQR